MVQRFTARVAQRTGQDADIRRSLVESLYASPTSLTIGAFAGIALSLTIFVLSHDPAIAFVTAMICLIGGLRVVSAIFFHRQLVRGTANASRMWELAYELGAWVYAALIGILAFTTVYRSDDPAVDLLSVSLAAGYAGGISGRNAGQVRIALGQTLLALGPTAVALWLDGNLGYRVLGVVLALMVLGMAEISATTHRIVVQALRGQREKSQLALKYERLASYDSLTGVENRMAMQMRLRALFEHNRKPHDALAILWMDLDRFKEINDSLGHMIGDQLLCQVAEKLAEALDGRGHVARFGGDEFILICPNADRILAQAVASDVIDYFRHSFEVADHSLTVTASIGIAVAPQDGRDVDELMQHADMALYEAKRGGRNRAIGFNWSMKERFHRVHEIETGLRRAIDHQELSLHFQPIFDLKSGRVSACEALLRWTHPALGPIPPTEFIPVAEHIGVIDQITDWVVGEACAAATEWPEDVRVAVNMSPALLQSVDLPRAVIGHLMASGLSPRRLDLEVTESVFMGDQPRTSAMLLELRKIGLRLALDDFGTGYSSLSYLSAYSFDTIKVDQSFMKNVRTSPENQAVVRAVAFLAEQLGMDTVAEGIENEDQENYAREVGFTDGQGFLLCQPQTRDAIRRMLASGLDIATVRASTPQRTARARG